MPRELLVVLPQPVRMWRGWMVLDLPLQYESKEQRQDERCERKADGQEEGEALRGKKSTR